jgi:integrase
MGHTKHRRNGTFTAIYRTSEGKEVSAGTFTDPRDADIAWREAERKDRVMSQTARPGEVTVREFIDLVYLPSLAVGRSSLVRYQNLLRQQKLGSIGTMSMAEVTVGDVEQWYRWAVERGMAQRDIGSTTAKLCSVWSDALRREVVLRNPWSSRKLGTKSTSLPDRVLTEADLQAIREQLPNDTCRLFVDVAVEAGLRYGEVAALRPVQLMHDPPHLLIDDSLVQDFGAASYDFVLKGSTKSNKSRVVMISSQLLARLHEQGAGLARQDFLFGHAMLSNRSNGGRAAPLRYGAWYRVWKRAVKTADLTWSPRFHDLRHACASWQLTRRVASDATAGGFRRVA